MAVSISRGHVTSPQEYAPGHSYKADNDGLVCVNCCTKEWLVSLYV